MDTWFDISCLTCARHVRRAVSGRLVREGWDSVVDGPVRQLNVLTANQQRCDSEGAEGAEGPEWNRSTARVCRRSGACYAALHQYGRLEPHACKWQVRLGLTCRKHPERRYRGPLPAYCDACDAWFPDWLGGGAKSWHGPS